MIVSSNLKTAMLGLKKYEEPGKYDITKGTKYTPLAVAKEIEIYCL